jgi:hypothetical protein
LKGSEFLHGLLSYTNIRLFRHIQVRLIMILVL